MLMPLDVSEWLDWSLLGLAINNTDCSNIPVADT